jgi:hypothetical protein
LFLKLVKHVYIFLLRIFAYYSVVLLAILWFFIKWYCKTYPGPILSPGVNFTNILWAAFAPKSFHQKITNANCKHLKAVQRTLVWLSISPIFYEQLFNTKVLCAPFMCLQFGFLFFGERILAQKLVKLTPGSRNRHLKIPIGQAQRGIQGLVNSYLVFGQIHLIKLNSYHRWNVINY